MRKKAIAIGAVPAALTMIAVIAIVMRCGKRANVLADFSRAGTLTLYDYNGSRVRSRAVYNAVPISGVLDALGQATAREVKNWRLDDITLPVYGVTGYTEDGYSIEAAWSKGYWIAQDGTAYRFDFDFAELDGQFNWQDEQTGGSLAHFPCARALTLGPDGWSTAMMQPVEALPDAPAGASATLEAFDGGSVTIRVENNGEEDLMYGAGYRLDALLRGAWYHVPTLPGDWAFNSLGYILSAGGSERVTKKLSTMYGALPAGTCRLVISGLEGLAVEFEIK